jgi:hypothetical protein
MYKAKPFSDLVDEDKRPFIKRRICSTLCGGYRTAIEESTGKSVPVLGHILQILIMLIFPASSFLCAFLFDDVIVSSIIGAIIPLVINVIL